MNKGPLVITGFGRSGTTWLSDILSKCLQGLVLFEPFHPIVFNGADKVCYKTLVQDSDLIKKHWKQCKISPPNNPWLVRNHLPDTENISDSYINYLWSNSKILGFKSIRLNHSLSTIKSQLNARVIYIYRSPLCVLFSINARKNFWNEFSWNWHSENFFKRALSTDNFTVSEIEVLKSILNHVNSRNKTILSMWAISFLISMTEVLRNGFLSLCYEDLYRSPYECTAKILKGLNEHNHIGFHPSYFFTPSMTSLRTIHVERKHLLNSNNDVIKYFLRDHLSAESLREFNELIASILILRPQIYAIIKEKEYLTVEEIAA